MSKHNHRMAAIGRIAVPPDHTPAGKAFRKFFEGRPPSPEVRKVWMIATSRLLAQIDNGAGLPMDSRLRYFLQEYNDRNFKHGLHTMPMSFNVLEAFVDYCPPLNYFRLREEVDHLVSFVDFLDYVTSPSSGTADMGVVAGLLEEGVVYSYNSLSAPGDITFSVRPGTEYGVAKN